VALSNPVLWENVRLEQKEAKMPTFA